MRGPTIAGGLKYRLKDSSGAIADYTKAIELKPNGADAYGARGILRLQAGDKVNGCADLKKAGDLGSPMALKAYRTFCK